MVWREADILIQIKGRELREVDLLGSIAPNEFLVGSQWRASGSQAQYSLGVGLNQLTKNVSRPSADRSGTVEDYNAHEWNYSNRVKELWFISDRQDNFAKQQLELRRA
jgi:hypothetical protein